MQPAAKVLEADRVGIEYLDSRSRDTVHHVLSANITVA